MELFEKVWYGICGIIAVIMLVGFIGMFAEGFKEIFSVIKSKSIDWDKEYKAIALFLGLILLSLFFAYCKIGGFGSHGMLDPFDY